MKKIASVLVILAFSAVAVAADAPQPDTNKTPVKHSVKKLSKKKIKKSKKVRHASDVTHNEATGNCINPATGLPMVGGQCFGFDVAGNPYGMNNAAMGAIN
jgi:hypothetical protein